MCGIGPEMIAMVDREAPFARLRKLLDEAISGDGRIVFISGEAGIGKTRLVSELESASRDKGVMFLHGRCLSPLGADPYLPFLEALRDYSRKAEKPVEGDRRTSMAALGASDRGGDGGAVPMGLLGLGGISDEGGQTSERKSGSDGADALWKMDVARERDRMYETISSAILGITEREPLLLFLDDLQWADNATLQLLVHISRNVSGKRVLILCAYRFEEAIEVSGKPHPLKEVMRRIEHERISETITLDGFNRNDTKLMLTRLLDMADLPDSVIEIFHDRTNGNPYFIEELVKSLIDRGVIDPKDRKWTTKTNLKALGLPSSVKDVIALRLSKLDTRSMKTLERASILGRDFKFQQLAAISEVSEEELVDDLDRLVRSKVLIEDEKKQFETYRFANAVLREAVYEGISNVKRRLFHKKVAASIEKQFGEGSEEMAYPLAHHYTLANETNKSVKYLFLAGNKAFKALAVDEADKFYRSALEVLDKAHASKENLTLKQEVLISNSNIHFTKGEWDVALKEVDEALAISDSTGNERLRAIAYYRKGRIFEQRSDIESARGHFMRALEQFTALNDLSGQAMTQQAMGMIHFRKGEHRKALEYAQRGGEIAEQAQDLGEMVSAMTLMAGIYSELGDFKMSEVCYQKAEEFGKKEGDPIKLARIYNNWGDLRMRQWRYADAIPILERSLEPGRRSGNLRILGYCISNIGECLVNIGQSEKARFHIEKARGIFEKLDEKLMISRMMMIQGVANRLEKKWDAARKLGQDSVAIAEKIGMPFAVGEYLLEYGTTLRAAGAIDEARPVLDRAVKLFKEIGAEKFLEKAQNELDALEQAK